MSLFGRLLIAARRSLSYERPQQACRCASTYTECNGDDNISSEPPIRKSVFISQSTDVFTNLALENWLFRNYDFSNHHVLLLWRNNPCLVFGSHQNPWQECDIQAAEKRGITLARRNSGGGTVYQDNNDLNLSFFTPRERYNRKYNVHIIARALFREWGIRSVIDEHDDIVIEGAYKVSKTTEKLEHPNAYHHCMLLAMNKENLNVSIEKKKNDINTNATISAHSPIKNLIDMNIDKMNKLITAIGKEYLRTNPLVLEDGGHKLFQQQMGFQFINPTEGWFPGINKLTDEFRSWSWNFGKTPEFTVTRTIDVPTQNGKLCLNLRLEVQNGIVEEVRMSLPKELTSADIDQDASVITNLCGMKYNHQIIDNIIAAMGCKTDTLNMIQAKGKSNVMATQ